MPVPISLSHGQYQSILRGGMLRAPSSIASHSPCRACVSFPAHQSHRDTRAAVPFRPQCTGTRPAHALIVRCDAEQAGGAAARLPSAPAGRQWPCTFFAAVNHFARLVRTILSEKAGRWSCSSGSVHAFWLCIMCFFVAMPMCVCVCTHMYRHLCVHVHRTGLHCQISDSWCGAGQQGVGLEILAGGGHHQIGRARGVVVPRARPRVAKAVCADRCAT